MRGKHRPCISQLVLRRLPCWFSSYFPTDAKCSTKLLLQTLLFVWLLEVARTEGHVTSMVFKQGFLFVKLTTIKTGLFKITSFGDINGRSRVKYLISCLNFYYEDNNNFLSVLCSKKLLFNLLTKKRNFSLSLYLLKKIFSSYFLNII